MGLLRRATYYEAGRGVIPWVTGSSKVGEHYFTLQLHAGMSLEGCPEEAMPLL